MPDLLNHLAAELGEKIAKKYRVPAPKAAAAVLEFWAQKPELLQLINTAAHEKAVIRTRLYKDAARNATRKVYFELRRYQAEQSIDHLLEDLKSSTSLEAREQTRLALVNNHISTAERMAHLEEFWATLANHWGQPQSILDVGCGIMPLLYPFADLPLKRYLALDRSRDSIATITAFQQIYGRPELQAYEWLIASGWQHPYFEIPDKPGQTQIFDIAFLFKLIPVVARQEPRSLAVLAAVPAKRLLVTGCKIAMVKQQPIARRERGSLMAFADEYNFNIVDEFETLDEVGLVLELAAK